MKVKWKDLSDNEKRIAKLLYKTPEAFFILKDYHPIFAERVINFLQNISKKDKIKMELK